MMFKYDGNPGGVGRFGGYHARFTRGVDRPQRTDEPIRAGVVYVAGRVGNPEEFAAFRQRIAALRIEQSTERNAWQAKLTDGGTVLEAGLDLQTGTILSRRVSGVDYIPPPCKVNDRDLAAEFLSGW